MADHQNPKRAARTKQDEASLIIGVIRIINQLRSLVREHGLRLFKGDAVLVFVRCCLSLIPLEVKLAHAASNYTVVLAQGGLKLMATLEASRTQRQGAAGRTVTDAFRGALRLCVGLE